MITFDTAALVAEYEDVIELCAINSGFAQRHAKARRGADTFLAISEYQHPARETQRETGHDVAELTIKGAVPDVGRFVIRVDRMQDGAVVETIYKRPGAGDSIVGRPSVAPGCARAQRDEHPRPPPPLRWRIARAARTPRGSHTQRTCGRPRRNACGALIPRRARSQQRKELGRLRGGRAPHPSEVACDRLHCIHEADPVLSVPLLGFDAAVFVVFEAESYDVLAAIEVPAAAVEAKAADVAWVGGSRLTVSLAVLRALPGAVDRTAGVQNALETVGAPTPFG